MRPLNQLFKSFISIFIFSIFCCGCGDHSTPKVSDDPNVIPLINITSGPYVVIVDKELNIGVETKFATIEPVYTAIPVPTGIAIVNNITEGRIVVTGIKSGTTTFTITDQANPKAVPRTITVTVNPAPSLEVTPDPITGTVGQSILLSIATLSPENSASHTITINDTSVARIIDTVNNPNLIDLVSVGTTRVTVKDVNNNLTKELTLTVTQ